MLAKIYRPAKTAMQSGKANAKRWVLEFDSASAPQTDALMGWTSTADPSGQVRLYFETKDEALAYARKHAIPHQVTEPAEARRIIKAYGDNFAFKRKEPWSH
ncbi:MAG TPA: ETC complex I subunit [Caulobacterales bacterium]|nr:ETC complex I subunit [Caulobacterales bacterium]